MKLRGVIFDLDGTIINTLADLTNAMNHALSMYGRPTHSVQECMKMIGNGVKVFARRALGPDRQDLHSSVLKEMKSYYLSNCCVQSYIYPGLEEVLAHLKSAGIKLAVVTNKPHEQAVEVVHHYFGTDTFEVIEGVIESRPVKPDPASTFDALKKMRIEPCDAIFIGDSDVDMQTAAAAGVKAVGATWGFRDRETLEKSGAEVIIDKCSEILDLAT